MSKTWNAPSILLAKIIFPEREERKATVVFEIHHLTSADEIAEIVEVPVQVYSKEDVNDTITDALNDLKKRFEVLSSRLESGV